MPIDLPVVFEQEHVLIAGNTAGRALSVAQIAVLIANFAFALRRVKFIRASLQAGRLIQIIRVCTCSAVILRNAARTLHLTLEALLIEAKIAFWAVFETVA